MTQISLSDQVPAGTAPTLISTLAVRHPDLVWKIVAPRLDDASLALTRSDRWQLVGTVAGHSADPQRVNDLEAYVAHNVPADARRPFLQTAASIHYNQRVTRQVLPEIDAWIRDQVARD